MTEQEPRPESEVATPPRGTAMPASEPPATETPIAVWGEEKEEPPRPPEQRRAAVWRAAQVAILVLALLGTAWIATDYARTTWSTVQPNRPAALDASGAGTVEGITVSLLEATDLGATPSLSGSDWVPPDGFHAWRVVLETRSTNTDLLVCDVALVDGQGREFVANMFVDSFVDGYEWSYVCGAPTPTDEVPLQQALLMLVPADAEPLTVQVTATLLNPDYLEFAIP